MAEKSEQRDVEEEKKRTHGARETDAVAPQTTTPYAKESAMDVDEKVSQ